ncbi:MAG: YbhB/YbcL family Raf kinase inhibitor-like protein [Chloroflexi bacterium]|nr:YbhB/YbcL family Raf kinase inhibitor-like protein [Chloroflexota bacterium]
MQITSSAFQDGDSIPIRFTCDGANVSPPLEWAGIPEGTKSIALIVDDPDAPGGTWSRWVMYGLPPGAAALDEGLSATEATESGASHGDNDFGRLGYGGPCPPRGAGPHRYYFKIYALDAEPAIPGRALRGAVS